MNEQEQHLGYLKIGYYVLGGIIAVFALFPLFHVVIGIAAVTGTLGTKSVGNSFSPMFGWLFIIMGSVFILLGEAMAILSFLCGNFIEKRKYYLFVFIFGCIQCALFPFGTALGVFTIITLTKAEVKVLFENNNPNKP